MVKLTGNQLKLLRKYPQGRVYTFIDASNLIYGTKYEKWKIDFRKLMKYLVERYGAQKVFYYAGLEKGNESQKRFIGRLRAFGYRLRLKPVKLYVQEDGHTIRKANCDVDMTFDMMRFLGQYQDAVIMTGDGDFVPVIEFLIKKKSQVRIIANGSRTAKDLKKLAGDKFIDLRSLRSILEYNKRSRTR